MIDPYPSGHTQDEMLNLYKVLPVVATLALALAACDVDEPGSDSDGDEAGDENDTPLTPELGAGKVVATKQIMVEPYKVGCSGWDGEYTCLSAAPIADDDDYSYDRIYGFDFEWGHRYTLEVNVVQMPEDTAIADTSLVNYELVELIDEQLDVDEEFALPAAVFRIEVDATEGKLVDQTPVTCVPEICNVIVAEADPDSSETPMVRLRFGDEQPLPLIAFELLESP